MSFLIASRKLQVGSAGTVAQNSTDYTQSMPFWRCTGYAGALVTVSAGSVTITQQCSFDGHTWLDPVDEDNTALADVVTTMGAGTRYVQYAPAPAQFIRFKVVETNVASTAVTFELYFQEAP